MLLVDQEERILAVLVARPADVPGRPPWQDTHNEVHEELQTLEENIRWGSSQVLPRLPGSNGDNRRGDGKSVNVGPGYGGGQTVSTIQ